MTRESNSLPVRWCWLYESMRLFVVPCDQPYRWEMSQYFGPPCRAQKQARFVLSLQPELLDLSRLYNHAQADMCGSLW